MYNPIPVDLTFSLPFVPVKDFSNTRDISFFGIPIPLSYISKITFSSCSVDFILIIEFLSFLYLILLLIIWFIINSSHFLSVLIFIFFKFVSNVILFSNISSLFFILIFFIISFIYILLITKYFFVFSYLTF